MAVEIIEVLRGLGDADFFIKITYVVILGIVGSFMLIEGLQSLRKKPVELEIVHPRGGSGTCSGAPLGIQC